jgi:hypothetical protein
VNLTVEGNAAVSEAIDFLRKFLDGFDGAD